MVENQQHICHALSVRWSWVKDCRWLWCGLYRTCIWTTPHNRWTIYPRDCLSTFFFTHPADVSWPDDVGHAADGSTLEQPAKRKQVWIQQIKCLDVTRKKKKKPHWLWFHWRWLFSFLSPASFRTTLMMDYLDISSHKELLPNTILLHIFYCLSCVFTTKFLVYIYRLQKWSGQFFSLLFQLFPSKKNILLLIKDEPRDWCWSYPEIKTLGSKSFQT